jgi:hypothetical protein
MMAMIIKVAGIDQSHDHGGVVLDLLSLKISYLNPFVNYFYIVFKIYDIV